jgi:hypothetical protein
MVILKIFTYAFFNFVEASSRKTIKRKKIVEKVPQTDLKVKINPLPI